MGVAETKALELEWYLERVTPGHTERCGCSRAASCVRSYRTARATETSNKPNQVPFLGGNGGGGKGGW